MSQKPKKKAPAPASQAAPAGPTTPAPETRTVLSAKATPASAGLVAEDVEPTVEAGTVPAWFFILLLVLVYWGMLHLDNYAGGFNPHVFGPYESQKQLASVQPKSGAEALVAKGEVVYTSLCVSCHQSTGLGSPGQFPPLVGSEWVLGSPNRLIRIPLDGLTGPIEVKGETRAWGEMPPFRGGPLLDADDNLAAVLTYIRQAWGNKAPPITPEQVKAVRAETASRSSRWTAEELLKVQ